MSTKNKIRSFAVVVGIVAAVFGGTCLETHGQAIVWGLFVGIVVGSLLLVAEAEG